LASSDWVHLRQLDISVNKIRNKGMSFLAKANWPKLEMLKILDCSIALDGLKQIAHARWSTQMEVHIAMKYLFSKNPIYLRSTDVFSVKVFSKQYSPRRYRDMDNKFGYATWISQT
jgi:Ran GTPase-activating protein (RanGAP) involved in mRNA processing and transport